MAYQSINPFTEQPLEPFPEHTDAELDAILAAADKTYRDDWRRRSYADRAAVLRRAAAILEDRINHFAAIADPRDGQAPARGQGGSRAQRRHPSARSPLAGISIDMTEPVVAFSASTYMKD